MEFVFGSQDCFAHCTTARCGVGMIRHHLAFAEKDGKKYKAIQCCRCLRLHVVEVVNE